MKTAVRYLSLETPDAKAVVDFISEHTAVKLVLEHKGGERKLYITVEASHGEGSSTWDSTEYVVTLPRYERSEREDDDDVE